VTAPIRRVPFWKIALTAIFPEAAVTEYSWIPVEDGLATADIKNTAVETEVK
jgi:hypothetical protein